ncbi:hypothetical protein M0R45_009243 [Rubus argutus]|uniref:Uncharacterized protein n=1 Tax=Rubus argutus TaxID=59490 RepID=A0AAW1Y3L3_RUBAR
MSLALVQGYSSAEEEEEEDGDYKTHPTTATRNNKQQHKKKHPPFLDLLPASLLRPPFCFRRLLRDFWTA